MKNITLHVQLATKAVCFGKTLLLIIEYSWGRNNDNYSKVTIKR